MRCHPWISRYTYHLVLGLCCFVGVHGSALGNPKKVLLVGSNLAPNSLEPLRFTQNDVEKMAEVLHELGGVSGKDIVLLQNPTRQELEESLARLHENISPQTQLVFYYSGHADNRGLLLGKEVFPLQKIRDFLEDERAKIRLGIIDACQSGALVRKKGGQVLPGVDIRLDVEPSLNGAVLITSSSAGEASLEVDELGGSIFTHFFVSGLRGAADDNQDGMVTLEEAFAYGSHQTLNHSSISKAGTQHPTFEYNLSGQRQLVISVLNQNSSLVFGTELVGSYLVFDRSRNRVVVEIEKQEGEIRNIQLPIGDYYIKKRLPAAVLIQKISLSADKTISVSEHNMHTIPFEEDVTKGHPSKVFQPTWKYGAPFLENTAYTMRRKERLIGLKGFAYGFSDDVTLFSSFFVPSLSAKYRLYHTNKFSLSLSSGYSIDIFSLKDERYTGIFLTTGAAISWRIDPNIVVSTGLDWELESWNNDDNLPENLFSLWSSASWVFTENDLFQIMGKGTASSTFDIDSTSFSLTMQYAHRWKHMRISGGLEYINLLAALKAEYIPVCNIWWRW